MEVNIKANGKTVTLYAVVRLTEQGTRRIPDVKPGTTFIVDSVGGINDRCRHVRDYTRGKDFGRPFIIWTLGEGDWEAVEK